MVTIGTVTETEVSAPDYRVYAGGAELAVDPNGLLRKWKRKHRGDDGTGFSMSDT
ncbi:hypothetical protein [Sneathiella sp.]|jgi:hypothetical protein|uniref:hypothetical protein n=1 Tax=Sneathiella sp. TaxID=1964365 RepID=UPI0025E5AD56|nr:hypothetical protein [Sneathiella sp.]|tara:strand:- start:1918 stop:2082 length:165 start_codon:yes stop_codon:yes gene_type:complete